MIHKLRIRFVILAMSTLLAVLLVLVGGINVANYTGIVSEADRILSTDNPGRMEKTPGEKRESGLGIPFTKIVTTLSGSFP